MKKTNYLKILIIMIFIVSMSACKGSGDNNKFDANNDGLIINNSDERVLKLGITEIDTLNPIFTNSSSVYDSMMLVFEPLFSYDERLNPIGVLAENCTSSPDGLSYTINLKEGVLWHDNTKLSSDDVIHTMNLIIYNDTRFTPSFDCIQSIEKINNLSLIVNLKRVVPDFLSLLTFPIIKNGVELEQNDYYTPVGTGPYIYSGKDTAYEICLNKNVNFRGSAPSIDKIKLKILENNNALAEAFNASEIDVISSKTIDIRNNTPRGEIQTLDYVDNNMVFIGINNQNSVLFGKNTRRAISYIINKDDIIENEIFSKAKKVDIPINPQYWYSPKPNDIKYESSYIEEILFLDGWTKNGNKFIRLIEEVSPNNSDTIMNNEKLEIEIILNDDNEERFRIAQKVGKYLNDFGIDTTITLLSFEDYKNRITEKNYQIFIGEVKMSETMEQYTLLANNDNYFGYSSNAMNEAIYGLGLSYKNSNQIEAYESFLKVFNEEMPFIPLFFRTESIIFEKGISGTSGSNMFISYKNPENWYLSGR